MVAYFIPVLCFYPCLSLQPFLVGSLRLGLSCNFGAIIYVFGYLLTWYFIRL